MVLTAGGAAAAVAATGLARPAVAQKANVLHYVPQANLANPDPIWTTATVASLHGYMVWDTLYGIDEKLTAAAADAGRPPDLRRQDDLDADAARRADVDRRRAGALATTASPRSSDGASATRSGRR